MKTKFLTLLLIILTGCSTLTLEPASFGWPLESVVTPDENGFIVIDRYSTKVKIANLFFEETENLSAYNGNEVRVIRNSNGYYFLTAKGFKHVYVFEAENGKMEMESKILISENGLNNPAFNQRDPFIELVDGNESYKLSDSEIVKD